MQQVIFNRLFSKQNLKFRWMLLPLHIILIIVIKYSDMNEIFYELPIINEVRRKKNLAKG
jgi:hypothetical protein